MKKLLQELKDASLSAIEDAESVDVLENLRVKYLGKKGELTAILKKMGALSEEERPVIGQLANEVREALTGSIESRREELSRKMLEMRMSAEKIDVTMPGKAITIGKKHPLSTVLDEAKEIFISMGFTIVDGPEIEYADYNFTKLNHAAGHPARDRQDTFYFTDDDKVLLRTQTSPMQVRVMETQPLPIRVLSPGRVYRKDEVDATHSPMFHQIEGLYVNEGVSFAQLKQTLLYFAKEYKRQIYSYLPDERPEGSYDGNEFILQNNEDALKVENIEEFLEDMETLKIKKNTKSGQQTLF